MPENDPSAATQTLLDGGQSAGGSGGQSAGGSTQAATGWVTSVPEPLRPRVAKFKDIAALAQGYAELESAAGSMARIPGENASPEEKTAFYRKMGRPERAEDYGLQTGDFGTADDVAAFAPIALEANLTREQARRIWDWSAKAARERVAAAQKSLSDQREAKRQALQAKWGDDFHGKADLASKVARRFGGEPLLALMRRTRLGDEPEVMEAFAAIGEVLSEDVLTGGGGRKTPPPGETTAKDFYPNSPKLK